MLTENYERDIKLQSAYCYYQNKKWKGGRTYKIKVDLNELPVFISRKKLVGILQPTGWEAHDHK